MAEVQDPIGWSVAVADLGEEGAELSHTLDAAERSALAAHAGIESVGSLAATASVRPWADGRELTLCFEADVVQACVVTLEPVPAHIEDTAVRRFLPAEDLVQPEAAEVEVGLDEEEPPEPLGERLDLGAILAEHFVLALDPYPRAPGAVLEGPVEAGEEIPSPFAALKALKDRT
jgi:uncharacterized metal-binding protein YceD (DUF177 family)